LVYLSSSAPACLRLWQVSWLRPSAFVPGSPVLLSPTMSDGHVVPGQLSDLYLLKALGMMLAQVRLLCIWWCCR
jgi:hypothetical protein